MQCFRLFISYIGTEFCGFQKQTNGRTVEGALRSALQSIVGEMPYAMHTAGRTDAGVHARGQVVSLEIPTRLSARQLTLALYAHLPKDMAVWRIDTMPLGFNARRQSIGKQYVYRIAQGLVADPFLAKNHLFIRQSLDVNKMNEAALCFVGEHDFSSFRSSLCTALHAKRFIWYATVSKKQSIIEIDIRGNAFCMNMVRIMAGSLIEVGAGKKDARSLKSALQQYDRRLAGITAKPCGLTLETVYYPDDLSQANIPPHAIFPRFPVTKQTWNFSTADIVVGGS